MTTSQSKLEFHLRPAQTNDLEQIIKLDKQVSGIEKDDYWRERFTELHAGLGGHIFIAEKPNGLSSDLVRRYVYQLCRAINFCHQNNGKQALSKN